MASEISAGRRMAVGFFAGISGGNVQDTLDLMEERENKRQAGIIGKEVEQKAAEIRSARLLATQNVVELSKRGVAGEKVDPKELQAAMTELWATASNEQIQMNNVFSAAITNNMDNEYAVKALSLLASQKAQETAGVLDGLRTMSDMHTNDQQLDIARFNADTSRMTGEASATASYAGARNADADTARTRQLTDQEAERFPNVLAQDQATLQSTQAGTLESLEGVQDRRAFRPWQTKFYEMGAKKSSLDFAKEDELWQQARKGIDRKDYEERRQEFMAAGKFIKDAQGSGFNLDAAKEMLPPNMKLEDFLGAADGALQEHGKEVEAYKQMVVDEQRAIDAGKGDPSRLEKFQNRVYQLETEAREVAAQTLEWKSLKDEKGQIGVLREHMQNLFDFIPSLKNWAVGSGDSDGTKIRPNPDPSAMPTPDRKVREESYDQGPPMARDPRPQPPYTPGDY